MDRPLRWHEYLTINVYWWGLSTATGILTPVLLPVLVALMVPGDRKTTYLAAIRVTSLAVAMMVQPMAGLLSDRSRCQWGRRRPYIAGGTLLSLLFLVPIGLSPRLAASATGRSPGPVPGLSAAYVALLLGIVLWQAAANVAQGALQGLIPDLAPPNQRGRASGVKSVMELLAVIPIMLVGPLVDSGRIGLVLGLIAAAALACLAITVVGVRERPLAGRPPGRTGGRLLRLAALAALFVAVTGAAVWLVRQGSVWLASSPAGPARRAASMGLLGLAAMLGAILAGVRLGIRVGIGAEVRQQGDFVWWVTNRLLFLAAVGSVQGFVLYFLSDVHHVPNPATMTTVLGAALGAFLIPSALGSGYLADHWGRKRLVALAGLLAAAGTGLLVLAPNLPVVVLCACVLGTATGTFMASNWALGTDLVPAAEAGRYLGISNLAGAGAGMVGAGIGGPLADAINAVRPGLGYQTVFLVYGALFVASAAALLLVREPTGREAGSGRQVVSQD